MIRSGKVRTKRCNKSLKSNGSDVHYIDKWCRFIIPFFYFVFIAVYWGYFLGTDEKTHRSLSALI